MFTLLLLMEMFLRVSFLQDWNVVFVVFVFLKNPRLLYKKPVVMDLI